MVIIRDKVYAPNSSVNFSLKILVDGLRYIN